MNGFEGIWAVVLQRLRAALRRARRSGGGAVRDPVKDRALLKATLLTRLSPHLRKDVGADEGE